MMRITMVIPSISAGGAERVMATMANYWAERGSKISLITFDDGSVADSYCLDPQIDRVRLNIAKTSGSVAFALKNNLGRVRRLRKAIRETEPDCVISFLDSVNVLTLIATRNLGIPVIVSERVYSSLHNIGPVWSSLRNRTYPWADAVVGATARVIADLPPGIVPLGKVIANPVTLDPDCGELKAEWPEGPVLISVGRLEPQKGFDTLLGAFASVANSLLGWNLVILGEGSQRSTLELLARDLKISERVCFLGKVHNPHDYMRRARIFVLSSRFEGFPNALCEAMASGLPVIATDCPSGPRELINDGTDGMLVPVDDIGALACAIKKLASDESLRRRLGESANHVSERFSVERIMKEWDELVHEVIERKARLPASAAIKDMNRGHTEKQVITNAWQREVAEGARFQFGANWWRFLSLLNDERIAEAELSLKTMLDTETLAGLRFLDIGSGSGLFSLAARRLGATVHSFDYDPQSVACARELKRRYFSDDDSWTIEQGSVLDKEFVSGLGEFDVVYSWGVLHHTGEMWNALENAAIPVKSGGRLFIAIYNDQGYKSRAWHRIKRFYCSGRVAAACASAIVIPYFVLGGLAVDIVKVRNPLTRYRTYKSSRGMSIVRDWFDWLGGYPFEVAKPEVIFDFFKSRGFTLERLVTCGGGLGNNQFIFSRQ